MQSRKAITLFSVALILSLCGPVSAGTSPVTTEAMLSKMLDLNRFADRDQLEQTTFQFASQDRSAKAPYASGWYANSDGFGGEPSANVLQTLREPDKDGVGQYLIVDVEGPGAIVRTWTPMPHPTNGKFRVYLDGSSAPVYDGEAAVFMRERQTCFGGDFPKGMAGFVQKDANYFPIVFAKGLRVEWTGKVADLHFYHFGISQFAADTKVVSFCAEDMKTGRGAIENTSSALAHPDEWAASAITAPRQPIEKTIAPGKTEDIIALVGSGQIAELTLQLDAEDIARTLRQTILTAWFDGSSLPQVEAPVGDFFGTWPGFNPYDSLPMTVRTDRTMICRFPMPFAEKAVLRLRNLSKVEVRVQGSFAFEKKDRGTVSPRHFHAKWRVTHDMEAGSGDSACDIPFLTAFGEGTYVGTSSLVLNPTPVITPGGSWWGEGDEKIWIDDKTFPAYFGTGSEDYYNYSWSRNDLFQYAYCAQPMSFGPASGGAVTNIRWHILDPIQFHKHIGFFMELLHHSPTPGLSYARTAYYYAPPETRDDTLHITPSDVSLGMETPAPWLPQVAGIKEECLFPQAEDGKVEASPLVHFESNNRWSGGKLLRWYPAEEGARLPLTVNVAKAGKYRLNVIHELSPAGGRYAVAVNGKGPQEPVADLYNPSVSLSRVFEFGVAELREGDNVIECISQGRNTASVGSDIGLDFFWLIAQP